MSSQKSAEKITPMKQPTEIATRLAQQWYKSDIREKRLLSSDGWPLRIPIGKPSAQTFVNDPLKIREHVKQWRNIKIGKVVWEETKYRESSEALEFPNVWELHNPSEWVKATNDKDVEREFFLLSTIASKVSPIFHNTIVRKRSIYRSRSAEEIILASEIAQKLTPQCASGKPLRALSVNNSDTKFIERNRQLLTEFLDILYENSVSKMGLETFLGAINEKDHWLLVIPLDKGLLPFQQQRIRSSELMTSDLPGTHLIIVENEQCRYHLPTLPNTVAILGAGLNLSWLKSEHYSEKIMAYWGDIDSWGLTMLANARALQPTLTALMMNLEFFNKYRKDYAIKEPEIASLVPPTELTAEEITLYLELLASNKGRLEQEFVPEKMVKNILVNWRRSH